MNMTIDELAARDITVLKKILPMYPSFNTLQPTADVEGTNMAIIQFEGDDLFIAIELVEERMGISNRTHIVPKYSPGYYKQVGGGRWDPPETEDVYIDNDCDDIIEALAALVKLDFITQATNRLDCDAFVDEMAFLENNKKEIEAAIRNK